MNYITSNFETPFVSPYFIPNNSKYSTALASWQQKHVTLLSIAPHLPHLYHSVTLWFFVDSLWVLGILVPRQNRRRLHLNSEARPEHSRTSKIVLFAKIVNGFLPLTIFPISYILDVELDCESASETLCFLLLTETQLLNFYFYHFPNPLYWNNYLFVVKFKI